MTRLRPVLTICRCAGVDHRRRSTNRLHRAWQPLEERLLRELQLQAPRRTAERRNLLQPRRSRDRHRVLAPPLQNQTPALMTRVPPASYRGHPVAGFAVRTRFASHASRSAKTRYTLSLKLDHLIGAGTPRWSPRACSGFGCGAGDRRAADARDFRGSSTSARSASGSASCQHDQNSTERCPSTTTLTVSTIKCFGPVSS